MMKIKRNKRTKSIKRIRNSFGKDNLFEILIFRSGRYIYAQIINSSNKNVLSSVSSLALKKDLEEKKINTRSIKAATLIGVTLARRLQELNISSKPAFNRTAYKFHGCVKALADSFFSNIKL